ncbi:hypothetical protein AV947_gp43 [Podophage Lau218]|uniref:Putative phage protein n=2 Tax=Lauvirus lau218 TaxID=1465639 RepID=A0A060BRS9_9CAUD|nr:hypothetical protein AV947_gp43 [Podophage Lau218]AIA83158.1 putative phage protein [Podophage Lau218]AIA83206.1 putative phage protein [Lauvirus lau218]AIA83257.1 putative phage protein [Lauvirus lau218]
MKLNTTLYADGENYFVVANSYDIVGIDGSYIIHLEGNPKKLYKLWIKYKKEIDIKNLYFMKIKGDYFKNHSEAVAGCDGLYKYIGS